MVDCTLLALTTYDAAADSLLRLAHHVFLMLTLLLYAVNHTLIDVMLLRLRVEALRGYASLTWVAARILATDSINSFLACDLLLVSQVRLTAETGLTASCPTWTRVSYFATMQSTSLQSHSTARALLHVDTVLLGTLHHANGRI